MMDFEYLVSVVVPIYNVENYLLKCLESLAMQTYRNLEVILVDDGSTDKSSEICKLFCTKDCRFHYYKKNNGGLSDARNYGLSLSKGNYICFVDADDFLEKNFVSVLLYNAINYNADISCCNFFYYYEGNKSVNDSRRFNVLQFNNVNSIKEIYRFNSIGPAAWNKLFSSRLKEFLKFPIGKISEDYFIMYKVFFNADKVVYSSLPLYNYVQRENSITKQKEIKYDILEAADGFNKFVKDNNISELYDSANMFMVFSAIALYDTALIHKDKNARKRTLSIIKNKNYSFNKKDLSFSRKGQLFLLRNVTAFYNLIFYIFKKTRVKFKGR